jgi:transcriptional regulator with XRE-family HTH domain
MTTMDPRSEVREFLSSRRARISPQQAGLPAYGGNRRVKGLRREEVAMLAGVSVDYYVRMERGNLAGASESVLDALASALQLDEAEREHLYALARESGAGGSRRKRRTPGTVRPALQQVLDDIVDAPAWIRNGRHDVLAMNHLARALYAPGACRPPPACEHRAVRVPEPRGR